MSESDWFVITWVSSPQDPLCWVKVDRRTGEITIKLGGREDLTFDPMTARLVFTGLGQALFEAHPGGGWLRVSRAAEGQGWQ